MGNVPEQVCHFSSLSTFCLGCKTISRRAARRPIAPHPKQNTESEQKWQKWLVRFCASKCIKMQQLKKAVRQIKG